MLFCIYDETPSISYAVMQLDIIVTHFIMDDFAWIP